MTSEPLILAPAEMAVIFQHLLGPAVGQATGLLGDLNLAPESLAAARARLLERGLLRPAPDRASRSTFIAPHVRPLFGAATRPLMLAVLQIMRPGQPERGAYFSWTPDLLIYNTVDAHGNHRLEALPGIDAIADRALAECGLLDFKPASAAASAAVAAGANATLPAAAVANAIPSAAAGGAHDLLLAGGAHDFPLAASGANSPDAVARAATLRVVFMTVASARTAHEQVKGLVWLVSQGQLYLLTPQAARHNGGPAVGGPANRGSIAGPPAKAGATLAAPTKADPANSGPATGGPIGGPANAGPTSGGLRPPDANLRALPLADLRAALLTAAHQAIDHTLAALAAA